MRISSLQEWRRSKTLATVVVTVAFVLDTLLNTVIVPMLPDFLKRLLQSEAASSRDVVFRNSSSASPHTVATHAIADDSFSIVSSKIGVLLASKTFLEMIASLFMGRLSERYGYTRVMLVGFFLTFASTMLFAFAQDYEMLLIARSVQGLGTAATFTTGFSFLADTHPEETDRANAIALAYSGAMVGWVVGPTFGGAMYQYCGKTITFLILAAVALVDGGFRAFIAEPKKSNCEEGPTMRELLADPYVLITLGALFCMTLAVSIMEPLLPNWMMETMNASSAQQGLVFLPTSLMMIVSSNSLNRLSLGVDKRWIAMTGLLILGGFLMSLPLATNQVQLILPAAFVGLGLGTGESILLPYLSYVVDMRHKPVYGTVYSLSGFVYSLSTTLGSALGGFAAARIGFPRTMVCAGAILLVYAPLLSWLRKPAAKEEEQPLLRSSTPEARTDGD